MDPIPGRSRRADRSTGHAGSGLGDKHNRRGSGVIPLPDLRGRQERGGWGRAGNSQRAPSAPASDLGASPFGRRPQAPLSCDLRLNHAAKAAWFKTPAVRVTVLALSTGVGSCSGFCLPRSGGISLPGGASPRVGAVGSEPPILLTRTPNGGDSSTRAGPGVDCDQAPLGTP